MKRLYRAYWLLLRARCLGPYEYDEEFVLGSPWSRLLWRSNRRSYHWWHSWSWRFTER